MIKISGYIQGPKGLQGSQPAEHERTSGDALGYLLDEALKDSSVFSEITPERIIIRTRVSKSVHTTTITGPAAHLRPLFMFCQFLEILCLGRDVRLVVDELLRLTAYDPTAMGIMTVMASRFKRAQPMVEKLKEYARQHSQTRVS